MKMTLTTGQAAYELLQDPEAKWTYNGAHALIAYLEQDEDGTGEEMECDRVAFQCEWTEYASALEAITDLGYLDDISAGPDTDREAEALRFLNEETMVVTFDGGIIVQAF